MKKPTYIKHSNLPPQGTFLTPLVYWMLLEHFNAPGWGLFQNPAKPHQDSLEDGVAYAALLAEEMLTAEPAMKPAMMEKSCIQCRFVGEPTSSEPCRDCSEGSEWKPH